MRKDKNNNKPKDSRYIPEVPEKASIGGAFNTGVTSHDPEEKDEIEKKGSLAVLKPREETDSPGN